ncbi:MAG: GxxExxY protein [Chitinophagaceae bacterium]
MINDQYKYSDITAKIIFFVEEKIMVELKAIIQLEKVNIAQTLNYLEAYKMEIGLLINFGNTKLEFKRLTIQHKLDR